MSATEEPTISRVAIVTGAGPGGLGHAAARRLVRDGYRVMVSDHAGRADDLVGVRDELAALGTVESRTADIGDEDDVAQLVAATLDSFGRLDALVNCAGAMLRKDVFTTTLEEWNRIIQINLTGTWLIDRAVGEVLCEQGSGAIVNVASVYADRAGPLPESAYYASKAGIANLTRGLAAEFGPSGVVVNCLAPGVFYPTAMTAPLGDQPETLATMTKRTMLGRLGDPERDIDGVVRFLVSEDSRYITGQTIFVDGGWSAW